MSPKTGNQMKRCGVETVVLPMKFRVSFNFCSYASSYDYCILNITELIKTALNNRQITADINSKYTDNKQQQDFNLKLQLVHKTGMEIQENCLLNVNFYFLVGICIYL